MISQELSTKLLTSNLKDRCWSYIGIDTSFILIMCHLLAANLRPVCQALKSCWYICFCIALHLPPTEQRKFIC